MQLFDYYMLRNPLKLLRKYDLFIKYCIIGATGVLIDVSIFYILNKIIGVFYQYANIISVSCGITNNFFLNAYFNFKITDKLLIRFIKFYSIGIFGLLLSALLLFIFIEKLNFEVLQTKVIVVFIVAIIQFLLNKNISFKVK